MELIVKTLREIRERNLYPKIHSLFSAVDPEVTVDGKKMLLFCSNDYLGLANHPKVKEKAIEAIYQYGVSTCASRLISGNTELHNKLERLIADFLFQEEAIVLTTGYMTNTGVIPALVNGVNIFSLFPRKTLIISDELNHASIIDGCKESRTKIIIFPHRDTKRLEKILKKYKRTRKIIITDAVFSMDGDIAPIPEIVGLAKKYNALTMIDEAHSIGVLGRTGRGILEYFNLPFNAIDILMGTLSKAIGSIGGYIAGSRNLIDFLRVTVRSYIFTASPLPPPSVAAAIAAIEYIKSNPSIVESLQKNAEYLRNKFKENKFEILETQTPIIPLMLYEEQKAIRFADRLFDYGILAPCVRWPAVPKGKARIRCVVMANHNISQLDKLIEACVKVREELG
ncbi:MAG: aminotransferase class I/II-fold pyridoxal phosphate-dependent enzyme [Candidatus Omnitrophica bacterium]|nr:aminotransferase class I/II-fold pyridoxal phosphate-dependent enzyme [Candidatus Omnitrophota bacterium]